MYSEVASMGIITMIWSLIMLAAVVYAFYCLHAIRKTLRQIYEIMPVQPIINPPDVTCPHCNKRLEIGLVERKTGVFVCPLCNGAVGLIP